LTVLSNRHSKSEEHLSPVRLKHLGGSERSKPSTFASSAKFENEHRGSKQRGAGLQSKINVTDLPTAFFE